jgi:phosphoesterase RecJ-like protein
MEDLKTLSIQEFKLTVQQADKIVIIPHKNPDGDAIGSSLGLYHYLKENGKDCCIVVNDAVPPFLSYLAGVETISNYEQQPGLCAELISKANLIFCLDYGQLHRT